MTGYIAMSEPTIELMARRNNKPTMFELGNKPIKPCPFCGREEVHLVQDDWKHWCCCTSCGVEGPVQDSRKHAVDKWQERAI